jgi:hypothetical protein
MAVYVLVFKGVLPSNTFVFPLLAINQGVKKAMKNDLRSVTVDG